MQIYTNFESNSQQECLVVSITQRCFRCKFTQILKAIHNSTDGILSAKKVVSDANLHKFWKQFTTGDVILKNTTMLFPMQIYTNFESNSQRKIIHLMRIFCCFRCKFTQILKAIHNEVMQNEQAQLVVSDANLHKFWKQFTTNRWLMPTPRRLFPMQIYTNFESNSQRDDEISHRCRRCFRCKFTQILKAIHNQRIRSIYTCQVVSDANLHKFWKQFTTIWHNLYYN